MPKIAYDRNRSRPIQHATAHVVVQANEIIEEYARQGFILTLRQLYYQFVARDHFANTLQNYKRLGGIVNNARIDGLIDWSAIEDRTRNLCSNQHWENPEDILSACAANFQVDLWEGQDCRCEVWIEKEALIGVIESVCKELDVSYFACRGYVSQSEMWRAARRLRDYEESGMETIIFHLGDHDPSGIDMTRDIQDRLTMFCSNTQVIRLALNMDQVEEFSPPPNPAKFSDSRFDEYSKTYGDDSWELDALEPKFIVDLIRSSVREKIDQDLRNERIREGTLGRMQLTDVHDQWDDIVKGL